MSVQTKTIRSFIAFPIDDSIKEHIREIQKEFKQLSCDIKWVEPKNIHVTLKFLGDIEENQVEPICQCIASVFQNTKEITTRLTTIGTFPERHSPRVVWVGMEDKNKTIENMANSLETALTKLGFEKDTRSFQSHITIGRIRSSKNLILLLNKINNYSLSCNYPLIINAVHLYKSTLSPSGPEYQKLFEKYLSNSP